MEFIQCDASNYRKGRTDDIKYIVIHYTSNDGDTAKGNCKYFQGENRGASAHYFVDEKEVCQSVKDGDTAWHCGAKVYKHDKCRNTNSIGVEMCSRYHGDLKKDKANNTIDFSKYYFKDETVSRAVGLTKELMAKHKISADNVIRHHDVTGKTCPAPFVEDAGQWEEFRKGLMEAEKMTEAEVRKIAKAVYAEMISDRQSLKASVYAEQSCKKAIESGIFTDGNKDGTLDRPCDYLQRQEFAHILNKLGQLDKLVEAMK